MVKFSVMGLILKTKAYMVMALFSVFIVLFTGYSAKTLYGIANKEPVVTVEKAPYIPEEIVIDAEINVLTAYQMARNSKLPVELAEVQATVIIQVAKQEGLSTELIVGIAESESLFNPFSVSKEGATGLMQILQSTGITVDNEKRFNIRYGIETGCKILKGKLSKNSGNMTKALSDYSGGSVGYPEKVYASVGRYVMYRDKKKGIEISMVYK